MIIINFRSIYCYCCSRPFFLFLFFFFEITTQEYFPSIVIFHDQFINVRFFSPLIKICSRKQKHQHILELVFYYYYYDLYDVIEYLPDSYENIEISVKSN
mgnify:CR=1 FL=1